MGVPIVNGFSYKQMVYCDRYLHNKQRKRRHYSQHVEDGAAGKETSLSRVTFGVLW